MADPVGLMAVILALGGPVWVMSKWLKNGHERKLRELELRSGKHVEVQGLLAQKSELEGRLQNLETIVCSVDFELNQKLNRLASQQMLALPAAAASVAPGVDGALAPTATAAFGSVKPGDTLAGRFTVKRLLGAGGMGAVFVADDTELGEEVAVKIITGAALMDPSARERFRREASAARRISHRSVVRLHDIGEHEGILFLSMEFVRGRSLADLIRERGRLAPAQLRPILMQVIDGLAAAHEAGVVHRDLKPANILVGEDGRTKVIDFGLAQVARAEGMTTTGMIVGTPEYMSPEQIRGQPVDRRADVYALGATIYHALTGRAPFRGASAIAVGFAHCNEAPVPIINVAPDVGQAWNDFVMRCLAKEPTARPQTMRELGQHMPQA